MADRYTVLCARYQREDDPEITATTRRLRPELRQSQSTSSGSTTRGIDLCRSDRGAKPFLVGKLFLRLVTGFGDQSTVAEAAPEGPVAAQCPGNFTFLARGMRF